MWVRICASSAIIQRFSSNFTDVVCSCVCGTVENAWHLISISRSTPYCRIVRCVQFSCLLCWHCDFHFCSLVQKPCGIYNWFRKRKCVVSLVCSENMWAKLNCFTDKNSLPPIVQSRIGGWYVVTQKPRWISFSHTQDKHLRCIYQFYYYILPSFFFSYLSQSYDEWVTPRSASADKQQNIHRDCVSTYIHVSKMFIQRLVHITRSTL